MPATDHDPTANPDNEPVVLGPWRAFRTKTRKVHIASALTTGAVRVTSALVKFDLHQRLAWTSSGRCYRIVCPPAEEELARGLLTAYLIRAGLVGAKDISGTLWRAMLARA
ncbi:hypothetical protein [Roseateles depolymerans]|uniref:Uncharacterized protein n=1 Tax=Roseateles depolymerans TaxID=76731 RepID=A0A0U3M8G3_9BURK|nr:hypothetical protein [Roseateles depolymerans]ALV04877.1 hypothetical protein RD2015_374 [Roseateles depolymerans]REG15111.1 hypothetical protein DES44_3617 [Roseateles depolymerans]